MDKKTFYLLAAAGFASLLGMRLCDALLPDLAAHFQVSTGTASSTISFFAIAYGVLQLVYGPLGDRYGKQRVIAFTVAASAIINFALAFSPSMTVLALMRGVTGGTTAGIIPLCMAHIGDAVPYADRQRVLAKYLSATLMGMIGGQWMGGIFADLLNWQAAFVVLSVVFGIIAVLLLRAMPPVPAAAPQRPSFVSQMRSVVRIAAARRILLTSLIEGAFIFSALVFIPTYLHVRFELPLAAAGAIVALYGFGGLIYAVSARQLIGRLGEAGLSRMGGGIMAVGFALLVFANHWAWAIPACTLTGLGFYMLHNTLQVQATQMAPHARGTAVSLFACFLFLGQSVGIGAFSFLVDIYGVSITFIASMIGLPALAFWFAHGIRHRKAQA